MPVEQEFVYSTRDGQPPMPLHKWVETLPVSEQVQFRAAELRQFDLRDQAIARGDLVVAEGTGNINDRVYVWKDEAAAAKGKGTDPEWLVFFTRYQKENGITFEVVNKSV
jgi:hypothetical protein